MRKELPPQTVPECICAAKHLNVNCPYITKQQLKNHLDDLQAEAVYKNLPNPEDLVDLEV